MVIGAGYIALEFASIFARLGSEVTVAFRGDQILTGFDQDMRDGLAHALSEAGITLLNRTLPTALSWSNGQVEVAMPDGTTISVDQVLVATGRIPNTRGLGLEEAGVATDAVGAIKVDAFSRSTAPSVLAVGDVTNRINLTPVAIREGQAVADTLFGPRPVSVDHDHVASAVFCTPEIGSVGLTEHQACERFRYRRHLPRRLQALEGDPVRPVREDDPETRGGRHHGSRSLASISSATTPAK